MAYRTINLAYCWHKKTVADFAFLRRQLGMFEARQARTNLIWLLATLLPASRAVQAALSPTGQNGSSTRAKHAREALMREIGHFIGGKRVAGTSGRSGDVFNPNTGEIQAKVSFANKSEVEQAIANAEAA